MVVSDNTKSPHRTCQLQVVCVRKYSQTKLLTTATDSVFGSMCRSELLPAYVKLLRDTEAEVRVAAAGKVSAISKMLTSDRVIASIVPCVKDLAADSSQHVRSALASVVMEVAPVLGKSATIEYLLPVFLSLLKDDFPDVRLNIISKLDQVNQVCRLVLHDLIQLPSISACCS